MHRPPILRAAIVLLALLPPVLNVTAAAPITTDLLIVGGTESGWAAALQAARLGVKSITLVHDGEWLGGQYTEQSLACVDENKGNGKVGWGVDWHPMKRSFHRFGLFRELMDRIEAFNESKYGSRMPGRPYHGPSTFRPAEAQAIFAAMLAPHLHSGPVRFIKHRHPVRALLTPDGHRMTGLIFATTPKFTGGKVQPARDDDELQVDARLIIDASDFGDVIQVSGAAYEVGPDPQSRYGEPSAPTDLKDFPPNEMNPITWAMIVEEADDWSPIPRPAQFDDRNYPRATHLSRAEFGRLQWDRPARVGSIPHWPDQGKVSPRQLTVYTVRRIVDGTESKDGKTSILLNYMNGQDYPLERLPQRVVDALEATEAGASRKNYVLLTRAQRQIIFEDAKQHSLGVLYHLQNFVHEHAPDKTHSFRKFRLSNEFGTADQLPPKPYIRESLRLKAMYMLREQDGRNFDGKDKDAAREAFANIMYPDGLFSWQFHYDFHRTGRTHLKEEGETGPWIDYEKPGRHTRFVSDRSVFPARSLIPVKLDGLLGAQRNIGNSSIVSAALRLHDHGVHAGQAAAALAAVSLRHQIQPREIPFNRALLEEVRAGLCGDTEGMPVLLWPYRDLPAEHPAFVAVNRLAASGLMPVSRREVDFLPDAPATKQWREEVLKRLRREDGEFIKVDLSLLTSAPTNDQISRGEFAVWLWSRVKDAGLKPWTRLKPDDADADGIPDTDDPLPFDTARWSWPLAEVSLPASEQANHPIQLKADQDGIPDDLPLTSNGVRRYNFTGRKSRAIAGFTNDIGLPFDPARGYGWARDISQNERRRGKLPEDYRDTFLFTRARDTWECAVPNGRWRVTVCVGDSGHEQTGQRVAIEGATVLKSVNTAEGTFHEQTTVVEIKDGRLTIEIGVRQPGQPANTCLNWVVLGPLQD